MFNRISNGTSYCPFEGIPCSGALDPIRLNFLIGGLYEVNWLVDNLPAAMRYYRRGDDSYSYMNGFPVGMT